jgi:nicotinate-nucleotide adenylyltransferase
MGGTFDPVHLGHLIMAETVMHSLKAGGMLFVPARLHPFKSKVILENFPERVEMVKLAISDNSRFRVEEPPGQSGYTIDLIDYLQNKYPVAEFFLPVGSDIIDEFDSWYKYEEIQRRIKIVIAARPGFSMKTRNDGVLDGAERIVIPQYDICSREIRKRVKSHMSIRYMVPEAVERYILEKGLYAG